MVQPWHVKVKWMIDRWVSISFLDKAKRVMLDASVYQIWKARNQAIVQHILAILMRIVSKIVEFMHVAIAGWGKIQD